MSVAVRKVVEDALGGHMTSQLWTSSYQPVFPFTPQDFSVGALLPMILYLFRWGHRRGKGRFTETGSERPHQWNSRWPKPPPPTATAIELGEAGSGATVNWELSIQSNPHLMVVGLPGMGKTTALINICRQLTDAGIAPIVFSYHDDIDDKLTAAIGPMRKVAFDGLGFNPLRVDAAGATAHIDVAGTLRDIFSSIFPDLGEIQLEELRAAIRQSYANLGWGKQDGDRPPPPAFRTFLDILRSRSKPNQNLLARLQELDDYGFFAPGNTDSGLLADARPTLVRVHLSTNDILQRAFAGFVLYSIYKDMFRR